MTTDSICRKYTAVLAELDRRLRLEKQPHDGDATKHVHWVTFAIAPHKRIKLMTLEALHTPGRGPGMWIKREMEKMRWQSRVSEARAAFSRKQRSLLDLR